MVVHLRDVPALAPAPVAVPETTALLLQTAPFMDMLATASCDAGTPSGGCGWYHGVWQYLRLCGLVVTPDLHQGFYRRALADVPPHARVLISGTADYAMLATIWPKAEAAAALPDVSVLDQCLTPLLMCRWYASQVAGAVTMLQRDILEPANAGKYDLIVADAFISRFDPPRRSDLLTAWANLLAPGGRVVTTVRVDPTSDEHGVRVGSTAARVFAGRASAAAAQYGLALPISPAEIGRRAERYAGAMLSYPIASPGTLAAELAAAGLRVVWHELAETPGEAAPATYLRLIAERKP